jgi:hypothetical protein
MEVQAALLVPKPVPVMRLAIRERIVGEVTVVENRAFAEIEAVPPPQGPRRPDRRGADDGSHRASSSRA